MAELGGTQSSLCGPSYAGYEGKECVGVLCPTLWPKRGHLTILPLPSHEEESWL